MAFFLSGRDKAGYRHKWYLEAHMASSVPTLGLAHAELILKAFNRYLEQFARFSAEAREGFIRQDWAAVQGLKRRRFHQYTPAVTQCVNQLVRHPEPLGKDLRAWRIVKEIYDDLATGHPAGEIARTFFNSVVRQIYPGLGADAQAMFVHPSPFPGAQTPDLIHVYPSAIGLTSIFEAILGRTRLPLANLKQDAENLAHRFRERFPECDAATGFRIEMISEPFFRNRVCYLIGRAYFQGVFMPCLIPLLNESEGIFADALITDADEMTTIFSVTRAYFLTQVVQPGPVVQFIREVIPSKPESDIYDALGFNKHGKTALCYDFSRHLEQSKDLFTFAPGTPGLVMLVFTLPSYPLVFKVIKEKSDPPKTTDLSRVRAQYRLVSHHERAGRLADTHEFEHFSFPLDRMSPELLVALQDRIPNLMETRGNELIVRHLYTERRLVPLNLYIESCSAAELLEIAGEYACCIRELAGANIFTGDMLLKNFGVTRLKRVVFYDYDEMGLLTDYQFRELPPRQTMEEIYQDGPWFGVGPKDVFPEEFRHFLVGHAHFREVIEQAHADLFTVSFWRGVQEKIHRGEWIDMFPYDRKNSFKAGEVR